MFTWSALRRGIWGLCAGGSKARSRNREHGSRSFTLSVVVLVGTVLVAAAAHADDLQDPVEATGGAGGIVASGLMKLFDRNGDGQLDPVERQAGSSEMLRRYDRNHNGQLDPEEQTTAMVELGARRPSPKRTEPVSLERRLLQQFDENHNGELDEPEQKVALKQLNRASSDRTLNRLRTEALRRLDTDGSGRVDRDELDALLDPPDEKPTEGKKNSADSRPAVVPAADREN